MRLKLIPLGCVAIGLVMGMAGCAPQSPPSSASAPTAPTVEELRAETHRQFGSLTKFRAGGFTGPNCPKAAYQRREVVDLTRVSVESLVTTFPDEAEPLRAYVRNAHPALSADDVPFNCFDRKGLISSDRVELLSDKVDAFYVKISSLASKQVTIAIQSQPDEGQYEFTCPGANVSNVSNSEVTLWRGFCDFSIARIGFKSATLGDMNLIDMTPTKIDCVLRPTEDADGSFCRIRY